MTGVREAADCNGGVFCPAERHDPGCKSPYNDRVTGVREAADTVRTLGAFVPLNSIERFEAALDVLVVAAERAERESEDWLREAELRVAAEAKAATLEVALRGVEGDGVTTWLQCAEIARAALAAAGAADSTESP